MNLIFDLDDTLYDTKQPFINAMKKIYSNFSVDENILFYKFRKHSDEVFLLTQNNEMTLENMHIYRIKEALKHFGINITDKEAILFQKEYEQFQKSIFLDDKVKCLLDNCNYRNIKLGIITNGETDRQWSKIKNLKLTNWIPKDNIIVSADIGISKPDLDIFKYAEKKVGITPESTYYIGDSYANDVVGAKKAGWKVIWYNKRQGKLLNSKYKPDQMVDTLENLLNQINILD
ncbi:HAD family hydrolase [Mammaliicoccus lentus]|uniref:HAD family hydrolase n=1 Tax=Mammaliicoccus lentus TaxID=42858 RepID=UPI002B25E718|nr:HAD family hydrolase [Mammaliicoccus lentus]WQK50361.1 HAD family hydrolase [Mammaliicoccus lentus]